MWPVFAHQPLWIIALSKIWFDHILVFDHYLGLTTSHAETFLTTDFLVFPNHAEAFSTVYFLMLCPDSLLNLPAVQCL